MTTIQVHNYNYCNQAHNLREGSHAEMPHVDSGLSKNNEVWSHTPVRKAYEQIFGEAVKEYNAKQKRKDRKIKDYYKKIEDDKQKNTEYEVVVGVYHPANRKGQLYDLEGFTDKQAHDAIKEYYDTWPERNPTLHLIGGYFHVDEIGQNHAHIGYFPVAKGAKEIKSGKAKGSTRGLTLENNLTNALGEMGFVTGKNGSKMTAQQQWERRESKVFEEICHKHGIENIRHPRKEKKDRKGLDMTEYKKVMAVVNEAEKDREAAEKIRQEAEQQREAATQERSLQAERLAQEAAAHAAELQKQREEQEQQLAAEKAKAEEEQRAKEQEAIKKQEIQLEAIRLAATHKIIEEKEKEKKAAEERREAEKTERAKHQNEINKLILEQQAASAQLQQKKDTLDAMTDALPVYNKEQDFVRQKELVQPKKALLGDNLVIAPSEWDKWQNNYNRLLNAYIHVNNNHETLKKQHATLQKSVEQKDKKIEDMQKVTMSDKKTIKDLTRKLAEKTIAYDSLKKYFDKFKDYVSSALSWLKVPLPEKVTGETVCDFTDAMTKRSSYELLQAGDMLKDAKVTVHEDVLGLYGIVTASDNTKRIVEDSYFDATLAGLENVQPGNSVIFDAIVCYEDDNETLHIDRACTNLLKPGADDGGITVGKQLKEHLLELEYVNTR